jgi:hypothetical protein
MQEERLPLKQALMGFDEKTLGFDELLLSN